MKCKRLFALLLSLCMVASTIIAVPVSAATETVVSIVVEDASDITWLNGGAAADADGIGGRDGVIELSNLANSNGNTAGVKLPDGFTFQAGDTLTYSVDVYSNGTQPDLWLRNHGNSVEPFTTFYHEVTADTWTTITKTITAEELDALIASGNGAGAFMGTSGNFALYFRPRNVSKVYVDNFTVTVERPVVDMDTIVEIKVEDASDITWQNGGVAADANGIGGRDNVVELSGLGNGNGTTAGVKLPDGFAFQQGDVLAYSFDVYSSNITNPDLWLRNHGSSLSPFASLFHDNITANTWTTITKSYTFDELEAKIGTSGSSGSFTTADNYALYFRPRQSGAIYIDNFVVTIKRIAEEGGDDPVDPPVEPEEPGEEPEANRENVIDIKAPLDVASELTWKASDAVTVSVANGIGGRNNVLKAEGLSNSNSNSVGIALPDGFYFTEDDILTYSVDVYSETTNNPDMWLRNHDGSVLDPVGTFYHETLTTGTWTTITKTLTYSDMLAAQTAMNSSGSWTDPGKYKLYIRPRSAGTLYLDNFSIAVSRPVEVRGNVINITVEDASDITWKGGDTVTATDVNGIGGRDGVIELAGLASSNSNTAGVVLAESFAFQEDDVLTYSFDVYSDTVSNPDIWLRNHGSSFSPFITLYNPGITTGQWNTVTRTVKYSELAAAGAFDSADKYALYIRPRDGQSGKVYIDNFTVSVSRKGYVEPPAGHEHSYGDWTKDDDTNHKKECSGCDAVITEAHGWDDGAVTVPPTTDAEGVKTYTCSACGATYTEAIDKLPPEVKRKNVISIDAPLDEASELTWVASSSVTVSEADGIGGRDNVLLVTGLANGNNNTAGIALPNGFVFEADDILTISVDVYSDTAINPDIWVRDHSDLAPFATIGFPELAVNTWTTLTKKITYAELESISASGGSTGDFSGAGDYKVYLRPRQTAGMLYVDNFKVTVSRPVEARANIIDIEVKDASDITWLNGGVATDANGIGGRNGVIELSNLANNNGNTAGVKLTDGFAFQEGDILTYSFDIYSDTVTNPDIWLRNHDSSLNPYRTFFQDNVATGSWVTITKTFTYEQMHEGAVGGTFDTVGKYALYFRPRQSGKVYIDNFKVTVERKGIGQVIDIDAPIDEAKELTWIASDAVVATNADNIGGRNDVVKVEGLGDGNTTTAGIKLPANFGFQAGDVIRYSVDVYSDTEINPDIWLRNHNGAVLTPFVAFYDTPMTANTWNTISKTITFEELTAKTAEKGYDWTTVGNYAVYLRPRSNATVYFDNFKIEVLRKDYSDEPLQPDAPHEHVWGEGVVTTPPTTEAEGEMTYTCSGCGATKTEKIDKLVDPMVITVGNATAKVGEEVTVSVTLEKNTCMAALQLRINYDEALTFVRATNKVSYDEYGYTYQKPGDTSANSEGYYIWDGENTNLNGEILQLTFAIPEGTDIGDYEIKITDIIASTWVGNETPELAVTTVDGKITATPNYTPGDVNGDGNFNTLDIIATRRFITGGWGVTINTERADVDADTKHTAKDVILMRRALADGYGVTLK